LVGCINCLTVYCYTPSRGTSTLNKHSCKENVNAAASNSIERFCRPAVLPNAGQKTRMKFALADMCTDDIRPMHMVANSGFLNAMQCAYDIGMSTKKPMNIRDLVCVPKTIKSAIKDRFISSSGRVKTLVVAHFVDKLGAGATTDLWTDKINNISYMSVTLHLVDVNFVLSARTISCDQFPENTSHTAPAILKEFCRQIKPYRWIDEDADELAQIVLDVQVKVTTDSASNNVAEDGFPSMFGHEPCKCHKIGTCVSFVIEKRTRIVEGKKSKPYYQFYDHAPNFFILLDAVKELVTYSKQSGINKMLEPRMIQHNPARWSGVLSMLNSVNVEHGAHRTKFAAWKNPTAIRKFDAVDPKLLDESVRFLLVFKQATLALEAYLTPTIQLVAFWRQRLIDHCTPVTEAYELPSDVKDDPPLQFDEDSEEVLAIKELILGQIMEKFDLSARHAAAAYLSPNFKRRLPQLGIDDALFQEGLEYLKDEMMRVGLPPATAENPAPLARRRRQAKRPRIAYHPHRLQEEDADEDEDEEEEGDEDTVALASLGIQVDLELLGYAKYRLATQVDKDLMKSTKHKSGPLLGFWKVKAEIWPIMARAARSILSNPASSAKSETNFSDAGNTMTEKRNGLKPATLNMLMFLRSNKD
jgi:hypothetical protein